MQGVWCRMLACACFAGILLLVLGLDGSVEFVRGLLVLSLVRGVLMPL